MELRHLKYFVAVAEDLNFNRAAEHLMMAQPPLSQQIRDLEQELGVTLFNRTKRKVELTYAGEVLLVKARHILKEADQSLHEIQLLGRTEKNSLSIGLCGFVNSPLFSELLRLFRETYPQVELTIQEFSQSSLQNYRQALESGLVDLVFTDTDVIDHQGFCWEGLEQENVLVMLSANHPLASQRKLSLQDLKHQNLSLFTLPGLKSQLEARLGQFNAPELQSELETGQLGTIVQLVAANLGIGLVPAGVQQMGWGEVIYRLLNETFLKVELKMVWRAENNSAVLQSFLKLAATLKPNLETYSGKKHSDEH
jgi:DNA-binding transcriptional LysR family regulator